MPTATYVVPQGLQTVLDNLEYDKNWEFKIRMVGFVHTYAYMLLIWIWVADSYPPHQMIHLEHSFQIPNLPWSEDEWAKWVIERIFWVHQHEAMEKFEINGVKIFAPDHDIGQDPYALIQRIKIEEVMVTDDHKNNNNV